MRWGEAPFPAWLGGVAWVRRLHAVEEGTPDLGYRQNQFKILNDKQIYQQLYTNLIFFRDIDKSLLYIYMDGVSAQIVLITYRSQSYSKESCILHTIKEQNVNFYYVTVFFLQILIYETASPRID
jgi:hypothetical protein